MSLRIRIPDVGSKLPRTRPSASKRHPRPQSRRPSGRCLAVVAAHAGMALQVRQRPAADGERLLAEAGHSSLIRASDLGRRRIRRWRRQDGRRLLDRQRRQARST